MKITYHYNGKKYDSIEALLECVVESSTWAVLQSK